LYVNADGTWQAKYIPAFVRRYPFVFSRTKDGKTFILCIDETFSGCNQTGLGERLFDSQGSRTEYLQNVLNFAQQYQGQFQLTEAFCKKLTELNLLEPMQAQVTLKTGQQMALTGFMAINRDRLKALPGEKLAELAQTNELELIYIHLQSMGHFTDMVSRLAGTVTDDSHGEDTGAQVPQASPKPTTKESEKGKKKPATALKE
jgi:hypothetical protein